ncbi:MAG: hypothetical protein COB24_01710 [Hyphomicrobiales bacterium]|nr:MAG: hypothetical protein COB24_01710 [Hyphomicrobiales bacterium]
MSKTTIIMTQEALLNSWSLESSSLWTEENPAAGHCGATALVVNDIMGGDILKTRFEGLWHFYNRIDDKIVDFTKSQFSALPTYDNIISNRIEAFEDTNEAQYNFLKSALVCWL